MATITSPRENLSSIDGKFTIAGVDFVDGVGHTDDEGALAYFSQAGYTIDGADSFKVETGAERPLAVLGVPLENPDSGPNADAADPRNDMIPVGGVKSDGTIVAPDAKGKRVRPTPAAPVQELGDPATQSSVPAGANPTTAVSPIDTTTPDGDTAPAADASSDAAPSKSTRTGA